MLELVLKINYRYLLQIPIEIRNLLTNASHNLFHIQDGSSF